MINLLKKAQDLLELKFKSDSTASEAVQQSASWMRATTWCLMGTAVSGVTWLTFATTEEIIVAPGRLEPLGGVREIQLPLNGVIDSLNVKEGERVKKGQILLTLDPEASEQNLKSSSESINLIQAQIELKNEELQKYLELNSSEQKSTKRNLELNEEIYVRLKDLVYEGASSELQLLEQGNRIEELKGQLEQLEVDRLRQAAILKQSIQQLRIRKAENERDLTEQVVRSRYEKIVSPVDGIVFEMKPKGSGYVSRDGAPVLKLFHTIS